MGSSKVVLVGATSLIVGIYSLSIKKVETDYLKGSAQRANTVQVDRLTEAGLRLAVGDIANNGTSNRARSNKTVLGGLFNYTIQRVNNNSALVTVLVKSGSLERTIRAKVDYTTDVRKNSLKVIRRGNWVASKYYAEKIKDKVKVAEKEIVK
jgi:hypothetical protein